MMKPEPRERGPAIYRWTPPDLAPDVLDVGDTPAQSVVYKLPQVGRTSGWVDYGGCIVYGYYKDNDCWEANANERRLVKHLIDVNGELVAAVEGMLKVWSDVGGDADNPYAVAARAALAKAEGK